MGQLDGKVTILTGAGTGIGKGIARGFAREGSHLILASRNKANLEAVNISFVLQQADSTTSHHREPSGLPVPRRTGEEPEALAPANVNHLSL